MGNYNLSNRLLALSFKKQVLFGACCTERIIHLYKYFEDEIVSENDEFFQVFKKGYSSLQNLLDCIFEFLIIEKSDQDYKVLEEQCLKFAPDTEEISSYNTVLAQNCAASLYYVFRYLSDKQIQNILYCSDKIIESIDIIELSQDKNEEVIDKIIEHEVEKQNEYINRIEKLIEPFVSNEVKMLRDFNRNNAIDYRKQ